MEKTKIIEAHEYCTYNRKELSHFKLCGCLYGGIDSIIYDSETYPV